jgi:hypothetical protein
MSATGLLRYVSLTFIEGQLRIHLCGSPARQTSRVNATCWACGWDPWARRAPKFWMGLLTELRNRGVQDTLIVCCDGLKGLPDAIRATWPLAEVQLCVVHLVRSSLRYTARQHWGRICRELREIYTAPTLEAAEARFAGQPCPRLRDSARPRTGTTGAPGRHHPTNPRRTPLTRPHSFRDAAP